MTSSIPCVQCKGPTTESKEGLLICNACNIMIVRVDKLQAKKQPCRRCKVKESVGFVFALCQECFDWWEQHIERTKGAEGRYKPTDLEFEYVNEPFAVRKN